MSTTFDVFKRSCKKEIDKAIQGTTTGKFPDWLNGSLLRNGPGLFEVGQDKYNHLFDGLALIHKFSVHNGNVTYQNHFLRSDTYQKNMKANRIVVSEFGTFAAPDPCKTLYQRLMSVFSFGEFTDNDVVNVSRYADKIYACTETNVIRKLDIHELGTLEKVDISKYVAVNMATAHPHYGTDGSVYNIGSGTTSGKPAMKIIKFPIKESDTEMFSNASVVCSIPSKSRFYLNYYHSFGMSENYIILVEQPLMMSLLGMVMSKIRGASYGNGLSYYPDKEVTFHVVQRKTGEVISNNYTCKSFYVFHHINAYEDNEHLVVDLCAFDDGGIIKATYLENLDNPAYRSKFHCVPRRYVLPLNVSESEKGSSNNLNKLENSDAKAYYRSDGRIECHHENLSSDKDLFLMELPTINYEQYNGKTYQYSYGVSNFSSSSENFLVKIDVRTKTLKKWSTPNGAPSEPIFVPSPDGKSEDDGVILSSVLYENDERRVSLVALDGPSFEEIGRADFITESAVTGTFHGLFIKS